MLDQEKTQFSQALAATLSVYGKESSPMVVSIWWQCLKSYDLPAVLHALTKHCVNPDTGQFPPKPADVVKMIGGTSDDRALAAWALVREAIGAVGAHNSVVFPDAIIHAVISAMGGWVAVCMIDEEELPFKAREFENRYRAFLRNPPASYPKRLFGIADAANSSNGYDLDPPLLMGTREECLLVYRGGDAMKKKPLLADFANSNPLRLVKGSSA